MSRLPRGWVEARLDDFCAFENGDRGKNYSGRSTFVASGIPFISAGHLNNGHIVWEEMNYIPQTNYDRLGSGKVRSGDFLFCLRGSLGKHAFVPRIDAAAIASSLVIVRPSQLTDCKFVDYYFRSPLVKSSIEVYSNGVAQPNLSSANLGRFGFPLPPLAEQKRIVAKLDVLNAKSTRARTELARIETLVSRYKQAVLSKAFSGELTREFRHQKGLSVWDYESAADACLKVQSGGTPKEGFHTEGVPFLKVYNIVDQSLSFHHRPQYVNEAVHHGELRKSVTLPGDVLMNIVGPPLGKVAIVSAEFRQWNINQALTLFRPSSKVTSLWLYHFFCSGMSVGQVVNETKGSAGQVNISLSQCRAFTIPIPTIEEQHEIVRRIESAFAKIDRLAKEAKRALELVGRLEEAILAKAFRGELVPQDENDEPAEHLLARIRAEREAAPKGKRGRGAKG